jgi:hypothetical protein
MQYWLYLAGAIAFEAAGTKSMKLSLGFTKFVPSVFIFYAISFAAYNFPERINGILTTGMFGSIPEYDQVIKAAAQCLVPGGRLSILDGKPPENLPSWLFKIVLKLGKQFGYACEYFNVRLWESVAKYFKETDFETRYSGMIYLLSGTAR